MLALPYTAHTTSCACAQSPAASIRNLKIRKFILRVFWSIIRKLAPTKISCYMVLVIIRARVPNGRYWHSSDVKHEGRREARVITTLLHEQLAKDLFPCCVPQRETRLLRKAYRAASLLGHALKSTGCSISKLTWTEGRAGLSSRPRPSYY